MSPPRGGPPGGPTPDGNGNTKVDPTMSVDRTQGRNQRVRATAAQLSRSTWELAEAVLAPTARRPLHRLRAAVAGGRGRPEADDDELLLQMAQRLRSIPGLSIAAAARAVVAPLHRETTLRSGDRRVKLGDARHVSDSSVATHLEQKFKKHKNELFRRVDSQEHGRILAQRHFGPVVRRQGGELTNRLPTGLDYATKVTPGVVERAKSSLSDLSLPDVTDGFLREARRLMRRQRPD